MDPSTGRVRVIGDTAGNVYTGLKIRIFLDNEPPPFPGWEKVAC